jgi:DNA replication protein DnaC
MENNETMPREVYLAKLASLGDVLKSVGPDTPPSISDEEYEKWRKREMDHGMRESMEGRSKILIGPRHSGCTFDNYEVNSRNREAFERSRLLADNFTHGCRGLLLCGSNGIGKNHLAAAVAKTVSRKKCHVFFGTITDVQNRMYDAMGGKMNAVIASLMMADLICFNDLGAEQDTKFANSLMFDLINKIYDNQKVFMATTNLMSDEEVGNRYGKSILSRLLQMCDVVVFQDTDHRIR